MHAFCTLISRINTWKWWKTSIQLKRIAEKCGVEPESDYCRHHRRRLLPEWIHDNSSTPYSLQLEEFYPKEFKTVLDTLTTGITENYKKCFKMYSNLCIKSLPLILNQQKILQYSSLALLWKRKFAKTRFDATVAKLDIVWSQCGDEVDSLATSGRKKPQRKNIDSTSRPWLNSLSQQDWQLQWTSLFSKLQIIINYLRTNISEGRYKNL